MQPGRGQKLRIVVIANSSSIKLYATMVARSATEAKTSQESTYLLDISQDFSLNNVEESELRQTRKLLYVSHLFNQFSENAWQFCLVLFLAALSNYGSLILVSTYGLCSGLFVCWCGAKIGRFIDGSHRLVVARLFIGFENVAVLLATYCCYLLLSDQRNTQYPTKTEEYTTRMSGVPTDPKSVVLLVSIHVLGAMARVLDSGFVVAIERDWIVVMSEAVIHPDFPRSQNLKRQKAWLSETNVFMKQIDLGCKIASPAFAGFIIAFMDNGTERHHGSDLRGAALFVGFLNASALVVEYFW